MGLLSGQQSEHRYQTCRDEDCQRFACRIYREGFENGYETGYDVGYSKGYSAGYAAGSRS
jgi:flagellar biosynthesis/type III secretory pathway protein FliH